MRLETERLVIRPIADDEIGFLYEGIASDPEVMRFIPAGVADSVDVSRERVARWNDCRARTGLSPLTLWDRNDGSFIGVSGVFPIAFEGPELEIGYLLRRSAWGKGYAVEAARACVDDAFARFEPERILALVMLGNDASVRVTEKLGMRPIAMERHYERDMLMFEIRQIGGQT